MNTWRGGPHSHRSHAFRRHVTTMASTIRNIVTLTFLAFAAAAPALEKRACPSLKASYTPVMGSGYTATVIANGMKTPRELIFDPLGNLLVQDQGGVGVRWIQITDNGGLDVCGSQMKTIVSDSSVSTCRSTPQNQSLITSSWIMEWHLLRMAKHYSLPTSRASLLMIIMPPQVQQRTNVLLSQAWRSMDRIISPAHCSSQAKTQTFFLSNEARMGISIVQPWMLRQEDPKFESSRSQICLRESQ